PVPLGRRRAAGRRAGRAARDGRGKRGLMASGRLRTSALVAAGVLVAVTAALVDPDALADSIFRGSWFYSRPLLSDLRVAGMLAGVCLASSPWLVAVLRRPEVERAAAP